MTSVEKSSAGATMLGLAAIVLWSTVFAAARHLTEALGTLTAATLMCLGAGLAGTAAVLATRQGRAAPGRIPRRFLFGAGAVFAAYQVAIFTATGLASGRPQMLVVGIINYLWPGLTLLLAVPILGRRPRWWLGPGLVVAAGGVALAMAGPGGLSWAALREAARADALPYGLALAAACMWGLYSNLRRRWAGVGGTAALPLFFLAAGLVLAGVRLAGPAELSTWSFATVAALVYVALVPMLAAYTFWDVAMRRGHMTRVVACSYAAPVLSTLASSLILGIDPGWEIAAGAALVVLGALVAYRGTEAA